MPENFVDEVELQLKAVLTCAASYSSVGYGWCVANSLIFIIK